MSILRGKTGEKNVKMMIPKKKNEKLCVFYSSIGLDCAYRKCKIIENPLKNIDDFCKLIKHLLSNSLKIVRNNIISDF